MNVMNVSNDLISGTLRGDGFISPSLLATIRVIQATDDEMPFIGRVFASEDSEDETDTATVTCRMISVRNEMAAYTSLRELLLAKLHPDGAKVRCDG
jgi:hypothetical protein